MNENDFYFSVKRQANPMHGSMAEKKMCTQEMNSGAQQSGQLDLVSI